ncbi:MAG: type II toxin-antitoxin system VapC family toxin [Actinomycetia bacterium]|nr:type II toxin-antitoxin system VapC family toxin [Actinomycetes bacterium]
MPTLLLDTHAFVWAVSSPDRLSAVAREALSSRENTILLSAASVWEMAIKIKSGKWPDAEPLLEDLPQVMKRLGAQHLDVSAAHAKRAGLLNWEHSDPFDRILAAQTLIQQNTLVSRDSQFANVPALSVLW